MTDIVERLRALSDTNAVGEMSLAYSAADEIERLRTEVHHLSTSCGHCGDLERAWAEAERLREVIALAVHMREAQTTYFKTRSKNALIAAKALEAEFLHRARAALGGER